MATPTRVGFIGAGGIARAHAEGFGGISDAEIVAVTDAQPEAAGFLAEKTGAKVFENAEDRSDLARDIEAALSAKIRRRSTNRA